MRIRFPILFCLVFLCSNQTIAQADNWQSITIKNLNSRVNGLFLDNSTKTIQVQTTSSIVHTFDGYTFKTETIDSLIQDRNPVDSLTIGPISDTLTLGSRLYLATINNGLWVKEGQLTQQFIIDAFNIPQNILAIEWHDQKLYLLTTKNNLFVWNENAYDLKEINIPKSEYISDLAFDEWDQLWLLGEKSLFKKTIHQSDKAPYVHVLDIKSSFQSIPKPWENLVFDSEQIVLSFTSAAHYLKGSELLYQYTVKNDTWSPLSPYAQINLTDLAPGEYKFQLRVKATDSELGYSEIIPFQVHESFMNSQWPWLIGGIGGLFLLWGISFNRQNQELKTIQNSANKYRLENQLLKSKQETQQLQMNPHFLFNSLNTIQGTIAQGDSQKARHLLNQYSQLMRSLLDQSREDEISIKQEVQFLTRYLELEQAARNHKFDFSITVHENLNQDICIPPMIIQPIIENAIVHGMKGISKKGMIGIKMEETNKGVHVSVDDNGVGRDISNNNDHKSHGISILKERIQSYSTFKTLKDIDIIDKIENGKPAGTKINVELPKL